jgi:hypothetical protein
MCEVEGEEMSDKIITIDNLIDVCKHLDSCPECESNNTGHPECERNFRLSILKKFLEQIIPAPMKKREDDVSPEMIKKITGFNCCIAQIKQNVKKVLGEL